MTSWYSLGAGVLLAAAGAEALNLKGSKLGMLMKAWNIDNLEPHELKFKGAWADSGDRTMSHLAGH